MIKKVKRIIAGTLAVITLMTAIPMTFVNAASDGEERSASIESLGKLGTVNIGNKSEGGTWVKTKVGDNDVFCLDLGKACHTGYIYVASKKRYLPSHIILGEEFGLKKPSMVLLEQIRTVNREDLREYIGTVDDDKLFRQINATLKKTFGLWVYKPEGKENIRCLCPKCLNDYIHNPDYIVRRLDPFAKRKDRCDKCDGDGWDYVVTDRYSSKKEKRGSNDRK